MADYLAVMILIAFIGYYAGLLMKSTRRDKTKRKVDIWTKEK